jgi:hypothetical protein
MSTPDSGNVVEKKVLDALPHHPLLNGVDSKDLNGIKVEEILVDSSANSPVNGDQEDLPKGHIKSQTTDAYTVLEEACRRGRKIKVIAIGAGASGLNFAHDIDTSGMDIELTLYEKNAEIGGTWYENK